jgi:hypothetical protein
MLDPSSSSSGPVRGKEEVNQSSEIGSGRTCARCLLVRTWRGNILPVVVDLHLREMVVRTGGEIKRVAEAEEQAAAVDSLLIGLEVIWEAESFLKIRKTDVR